MKDCTTDKVKVDLLTWGWTPKEWTQNYITALAGGTDLPCLWILIYPDGRTEERWAALDDAHDWLQEQNEQEHAGVYVTIQMTDGHGRRRDNIVAGRVVAGDADGVTIDKWHQSPTMVVQSKAGPHPYFVLGAHASVDETEAACRGLAYHYGLDPAATDPQRILRVPGFFHTKDPANPFMVALVAPEGQKGPTYTTPASADPEPGLDRKAWGTYQDWTGLHKTIKTAEVQGASEPLPPYRKWTQKVRPKAVAWREYAGLLLSLRRRMETRRAGATVILSLKEGAEEENTEPESGSRLEYELGRVEAWLRENPVRPWSAVAGAEEWKNRAAHAEFSAMAAIIPPVSGVCVQDFGTPEWTMQQDKARAWVSRVRTWEARHWQWKHGSRNPGASQDPGPFPGGFDPEKISMADVAALDAPVAAGRGDLTTLRVVQLFEAHGWVRQSGGDDWSEVVCPWHHRHGPGTGSTAYVKPGLDSEGRPGAGKPAAFHCFHGSCQSANITSVIQHLGTDVVDAYCDRVLSAAQVDAGTARMSVGDVLPTAPEDAHALVVPPGWRLGSDGVYRDTRDGELLVASSPVLLGGGAEDLGGGPDQVTVHWMRADRWRQRLVPRRTIADSRRVVDLADAGAPVTSGTAGQIVGWFAAFESANETAMANAALKVSTRMGWIPWTGSEGPGIGFLLGDRWIPFRGTSTVSFSSIDSNTNLTDAVSGRGTLTGWLKAVKITEQHPLALTAVYSSLAAPLLFILDVPGFVVEWSGTTSGGKTTALRLAASVWGRPGERGLVQTWDATAVGRERLAAALCDLPLILDDTQRARRGEDITSAIYQLASGKGRSRGALQGMRRTDTWRTIVHSSGERTCTSFDVGAGGAAARVISLWGKPFGDDPDLGRLAVEGLLAKLRHHHGVAGGVWIKWIGETLRKHSSGVSDLRKDWRDKYQAAVQKCLSRLPTHNAIGARLAESMGLLVMTESLAQKALGLPAFDLLPVWDMVVRDLPESDRSKAAFIEVYEWASSHPDLWFNLGTDQSRTYSTGWVGRWDGKDAPMCWVKMRLRAVLEKLGYPAEATIQTWIDRQWLDAGNDGRGGRTRLGGQSAPQVRVLAVHPEAVAKIVGTHPCTTSKAEGFNLLQLDEFRPGSASVPQGAHDPAISSEESEAVVQTSTSTSPAVHRPVAKEIDDNDSLKNDMRSPWPGGIPDWDDDM